MADTTGKETPATDPKSATGTGPVKPPVLEGTARPTSTSKSGVPTGADKPAAGNTSKPAPAQPAPKPRSEETEDSGSAGWLAGILGAVVGLGAAYGLAWFGLWPQPAQVPVPTDPRLAQFATAIPELETVTGTVQDELSTLTGRVGALETIVAEAPVAASTSADPALSQQLADLSARLDDLAAASGEAVGADILSTIQTELESLRAASETAATGLAAAQQEIDTLSEGASEVAGSEAATARLPLIFSGLESAFSAGRGFETELAALRQALPDTQVPEAIAWRAATGLARPDDVRKQLAAVLPDMLAGRPANAGANWQDATADWFRGVVAMRPDGAVEGNGADAIIARLEAAVAQRDFVSAEMELSALPDTMRNAAGAVAGDIASLATAETFLAQLRARALTGENGV